MLAKAREQLQCQKSALSKSGKKMIRTFGRRRWTELDHLTTTPLRHTNAYAIIRRRGSEHRGRARQSRASGRWDHGLSEEWRTLEVTAATADHASTRRRQPLIDARTRRVWTTWNGTGDRLINL